MTEPKPRPSFITEHGTYINLGLFILLLVSTVTGVTVFVRGMAQVEASNGAVAKLQVSADETNKVTAELNETMVRLEGSVNNLGEKIGELQTDNKQAERDAQERTAEIVRLQADLQPLKDRVAANEANVKALESRMLSLEIAVSARSQTPVAPPARAGSE